MPYIPKEHEKYDLLPFCREIGGEVFSYSSTNRIDKLLPEGEHIIPYGYNSYEDYDIQLDEYLNQYGYTDGALNLLGQMLIAYKSDIKRRNIKEDWSVVQYIGRSTNTVGGFTHGRYYYWPCSRDNPEYEGVVDDEEFTSYIGWSFSDKGKIEPVINEDTGDREYIVTEDIPLEFITYSNWVIAEDPTGMAAKVLSGESSDWWAD